MDDKTIQQNRERVKKHLEQKKNEGFKRVSFFISGTAYEQLQLVKSEMGQSTGQLIEFLIMNTEDADKHGINVTVSLPPCKVEPKNAISENKINQQADDDSHIESLDDSIQAGKAELEVIVPVQSEEQENSKETSSNGGEPESLDLSEIDKENISIEERDRIIFQIHEQYPGRKFAQKRIDILNEANILFNGRQWVKKDFSDQLCRARERMKTQQRNLKKNQIQINYKN